MTPAVIRVIHGAPTIIFPTVPFDENNYDVVLAMDDRGVFFACDKLLYESGSVCTDDGQLLAAAVALTDAGFLLYTKGVDYEQEFGMEEDSPMLLRADDAWTRFHDKMRFDAMEADEASQDSASDGDTP